MDVIGPWNVVHGPSPPQKNNLVMDVIDHERGAWSELTTLTSQ